MLNFRLRAPPVARGRMKGLLRWAAALVPVLPEEADENPEVFKELLPLETDPDLWPPLTCCWCWPW